jgi:hypothetical protein
MTLAIGWVVLHSAIWTSRRLRRRHGHEPRLWPVRVRDVPTGVVRHELWKYDDKLQREVPRC